jgi:hypothetical protein
VNKGFGYLGLLLVLAVVALFGYAMLETITPVADKEGTEDISSVIDSAHESATLLRDYNSNIENEL